MSKESVEKMVDEIEEDLNHINASGKFEDYSEYIKRYADTFLHKNHYLIMTAARNLIQWYTYKNGDPNRFQKLQKFTREVLTDKVNLCKQLDFVLSRIDPGYSEIRS